ncbi:PPE domain-containing protein [Pseudonocardiaceae bacterium YIM PH 21723]|nr:PPE domain-containing protein [Pseudonocardiaceae bacterium YIM PH 21723]
MGEHRWRGYSHEELYRQIHAGPGPNGSTTAIGRWQEMAKTLTEIDDDIKRMVRNGAVSWEGAAADQTRAGMTPLAQWAAEATANAESMKQHTEQQATNVGKARSDMPAPEQVTAEEPSRIKSAVVHLFGGQTDYERQEAAQAAAEQRAFEVMHNYETASLSTASALTPFSPAPQVVVDAPIPVRGEGGAVNYVFSHGGARVGGASGSAVRGGAGGTPSTGRAGGTTTRPGTQPGTAGTSNQTTGGNQTGRGGASVGSASTSAGSNPQVKPSDTSATRPAAPSTSVSTTGPTGTTVRTQGSNRADRELPAQTDRRGTETTAASAAGPITPGAAPAARRGEQSAGAPLRARGAHADGDEDHEHRSFLVETDDLFGENRMVVTPVLGEDVDR